VIRRGFWLTTGAVTGIVAYRRVSAVGRRVSASLNPRASLNPGASLNHGASLNPGSSPRAAGLTAGTRARPAKPLFSVRSTRRTAIRAARETYRFTRDVRDGMELYMARHSGPESPTLGTNQDAQPPALVAARPTAARSQGQRDDDEKDGH
jgi:hypothetical protein